MNYIFMFVSDIFPMFIPREPEHKEMYVPFVHIQNTGDDAFKDFCNLVRILNRDAF